MNNRSGIAYFTLIELLVVIAVVGVLTSMLLPSLTKVRFQTLNSVCQNNQNQLQIALHSYGADSNSYLPECKSNGSPQFTRYFYHKRKTRYTNFGLFYKHDYIKGRTLFCPQLNINKSATKQDYSWYVRGGVFDPESTLNETSVKAPRSAYSFYPYPMPLDERNGLRLGQLDNDEMLISDYIATKSHDNHGIPGWNVTRANGSTKFKRSSMASVYVDANSNIWSDWSKDIIMREFLLK